ncbi:MAG: tRNA (guanosine(46)-N7)-methyltransferase TrmB [Bacillota bacterium]|nr:tRNA (guanosine(46)-N7)-methyltransferase TrmB [Bacillota bacterium]
MRLRKKWWARPEMEASDYVITEPVEIKGNWKNEFGSGKAIYLELGCGRGRFISTRAEQNKDINYIGIDLKDEVLIYALRKVEEKQLPNVRLIPMNISGIQEVFDKDEIERIYINFCNPWPKVRHNKRRLTHTGFLEVYKGFLKPGSEIWFKTDDHGLFDDSVVYFEESGFRLRYITYDLNKSGFEENVVTEYEEKFTALGMQTMFLIAVLDK